LRTPDIVDGAPSKNERYARADDPDAEGAADSPFLGQGRPALDLRDRDRRPVACRGPGGRSVDDQWATSDDDG